MCKAITISVLLFLGAMVHSLPVAAHAILVNSQPGKGEELTESPKQIDLWFNEPVRSEYKAVAVIDGSGRRVDNRDVEQNPADGSHIHVTVPKLEPGNYMVRYRVVSQDAQIFTGKFEFILKAP